MARDGRTYRAARRNDARRIKHIWSRLPLATLRLEHSRANIAVKAVPTGPRTPDQADAPTKGPQI